MLMNFIFAWNKDVEKMHAHLEYNHKEHSVKKEMLQQNNLPKANKI
jgi:hypothetical protein